MIIKYSDLIRYQELRVNSLKFTRLQDQKNGVTRFDGINKNIEVAERILMLLKKWQKDPEQADLFELNTQLNHK